MCKYIGFDVDDNKTAACIVQKGSKGRYKTVRKFNRKALKGSNKMRFWLLKARDCHANLRFAGNDSLFVRGSKDTQRNLKKLLTGLR